MYLLWNYFVALWNCKENLAPLFTSEWWLIVRDSSILFLHFSRNEKRFGINYLWSFFSSSTWHSGDNIIWSKAVLSKHLYRRIWFKERITVSAWIHLKKIIPLFNFSVLLFTLGMAHSCSICLNLNHPFHVRIKYNFKTTGKFYKASPPLYLIRILCTSPTAFPVTLIPINQIISQLYK